MGKLSGVLSSAIFFGLFAILVYFCCRVKRRGAVLQRANGQAAAGGTHIINNVTVPQPQPHPQHISGGLVGYPQQNYAQQHPHGIYGPTTQPYPPYSMNNGSYVPPHSNLPYPANPGNNGGMPMPGGVGHNTLQQSSAPYPMASAPINEDYDKPPAYEDVIRQQK